MGAVDVRSQPPEPGSRDARKLRTHRALLDAALHLLEGERSFSSLSLREVARAAGIVPAAFYRHFDDLSELGLELVDDAFATLHDLMREVRHAPLPPTHLIRGSVDTFLDYVQAHPLHFRFIAKERYSGSSPLRRAIRAAIDAWIAEIADDLVRLGLLTDWRTEDRRMVAGLIVQAVVAATELTLDLDPADAGAHARLRRQTEHQLQVAFLGATHWRPASVRPAPRSALDDAPAAT